MINNKKVIAFDLDGTLAESKSKLTPEMSEVLAKLLEKYYVAVISGGAYTQFQKQFLSSFSAPKEFLKNLYLFPTMGSTCYKYDEESAEWKMLYEERLAQEEIKKIMKAFNESIMESGFDLSGSYGEILEDRGTQVTFSGCGQEAPIDVKTAWDPDRLKRELIVSLLKKKIPEFDIRIGGISSIDVTKMGIDKAYAIGKIRKLLDVTDDKILFIGDALYKGGNDAPVKKTDVDFIQPDDPSDTLELLKQYI
jgi:HAD superfamily hydrolase (TIGR01484 family)